MEYWSWRVFALVLAIQIIRCIRRYGLRNLRRWFRLWREGVTTHKQRRQDLAALGVLLALAVIGVLFWLIP